MASQETQAQTAFYGAKSYDKDSFAKTNRSFPRSTDFFGFHLNPKTAFSAGETLENEVKA